jgi:hypothetical protein
MDLDSVAYIVIVLGKLYLFIIVVFIVTVIITDVSY